jgi:hypothetical protein
MNLLSLCWSVWFGPILCFPSIVLGSHKLNYKAMLKKNVNETKTSFTLCMKISTTTFNL